MRRDERSRTGVMQNIVLSLRVVHVRVRFDVSPVRRLFRRNQYAVRYHSRDLATVRSGARSALSALHSSRARSSMCGRARATLGAREVASAAGTVRAARLVVPLATRAARPPLPPAREGLVVGRRHHSPSPPSSDASPRPLPPARAHRTPGSPATRTSRGTTPSPARRSPSCASPARATRAVHPSSWRRCAGASCRRTRRATRRPRTTSSPSTRAPRPSRSDPRSEDSCAGTAASRSSTASTSGARRAAAGETR